MSFHVGNDFFDGDSIERFAVSNIHREEEHSAAVSENHFPIDQVTTSISGSEMRLSSVVDATTYTSDINSLGEDVESISGGITILSSAASSVVHISNSNASLPLPPISTGTGPTPFESDHALSISTTESLYATLSNDAPIFDDSASRSSLSLNPSSLASSEISNFTLNLSCDSPAASSEALTLPVSSDWVVLGRSEALIPTIDVLPRQWHEEIRTEYDWDLFYCRAQDVLSALGRENLGSTLSPDHMLALLIQEEEESQLYKRTNKENTLFLNWTQRVRDYLLIAATAALAASFGTRLLLSRHQ